MLTLRFKVINDSLEIEHHFCNIHFMWFNTFIQYYRLENWNDGYRNITLLNKWKSGMVCFCFCVKCIYFADQHYVRKNANSQNKNSQNLQNLQFFFLHVIKTLYLCSKICCCNNDITSNYFVYILLFMFRHFNCKKISMLWYLFNFVVL